MKKVLIIAYHFSRKEEIGSSRLRGLAKYLPDFGWEPTILTVKATSDDKKMYRIREAEFQNFGTKWRSLQSSRKFGDLGNINRFSTFNGENILSKLIVEIWNEIIFYPDDVRSWQKKAIKAGNEILLHDEYDAIVTSSNPVTAHIVGKVLCKKHNVPWLADFRDLWTQNHTYDHSQIRKCLDVNLETKTLQNASALTTVTEPLAKKLGELHVGKKVYAISNGYDPELLSPKPPLGRKFRICYTGRIYRGYQDPTPFLKAISRLVKERRLSAKDISVDFYGPSLDWLDKFNKDLGLNDIVHVHGFVSKEEVIAIQRTSHLLLLLVWNDKDDGICPAKLFDYLAAQRPIIAYGAARSVVDDIIKMTEAGYYTTSDDQIFVELSRLYNEYIIKGMVEFKGDIGTINLFSQRGMASKFAEILNTL